jgi:hypothetical protein
MFIVCSFYEVTVQVFSVCLAFCMHSMSLGVYGTRFCMGYVHVYIMVALIRY